MSTELKSLKWWLIYGPPRTGTSYLSRLISERSTYLVSDWGLGNIINRLDNVRDLNIEKFKLDLIENILASARRGGGKVIDLCYKQATLLPAELDQLTTMFGAPQRKIFCVRDPAGFMASAVKKFPNFTSEDLENRYLRNLAVYEKIGGDIIEYGPKLSHGSLKEFVSPINLPNSTEEFKFRGSERPDLVSDQMQEAYENFISKYFDSPEDCFKIFE